MATAFCTILSRGDAIVRGRSFPFALGIMILLASRNLNIPVARSFDSFSKYFRSIPSRVSGVFPGVMFPGLDLICA